VDSPVASAAEAQRVDAGVVSSGAARLAADVALDQSAMERVSRELASYIGPVAEVVVKRAARRCGSMPELCSLVAQEIEGSGERARFLASCGR
jgi:serine/threonine-protein kinase